QLDASREAVLGAVEVVARADDAIARHGQEGAAEHIEVRRGGRVGVGGGALGGVLLVPAYACYALCIPSPPRLGRIGGQRLEVLGDIAANVGVGARVASLLIARRAGVVDIVGGLLPRVEHHLFVGVVRVQHGDDALGRVVEQHRADTDADI